MRFFEITHRKLYLIRLIITFMYTHAYERLDRPKLNKAKHARNILVHCTAQKVPGSTCCSLYLQESNQTRSIYLIQLLNLHYQALTAFIVIYAAFWTMNYFQLYGTFSQGQNVASISPPYRYFYGKCLHELQFLVLPAQTFRTKSHPASDRGSNPYYIFLISLVYSSSYRYFFGTGSERFFSDQYNSTLFKFINSYLLYCT